MSLVKNAFLFFCIYKMYLLSAEGYEYDGVDLLIINKTGEVWTKMKDIQNGLVVQDISDLVLKEIYGIYKIRSLTKKSKLKNTKWLNKKYLKSLII